MFCLNLATVVQFPITEALSLKNSSVNTYKIQLRLIVKRPAMMYRLEG